MRPKNRPVEINISGIPVAGIGGLGLVAIAALMTYVMPEAWLFVAFGAIGGVVLGIVLVFVGRRAVKPGPSGDDPRILFRTTPNESGAPGRKTTPTKGDLKDFAAVRV